MAESSWCRLLCPIGASQEEVKVAALPRRREKQLRLDQRHSGIMLIDVPKRSDSEETLSYPSSRGPQNITTLLHKPAADPIRELQSTLKRTDMLTTKTKPIRCEIEPHPPTPTQISFEFLTKTNPPPNSKQDRMTSDEDRYIPRPQPFNRSSSHKRQSSKGSMLLVCADSEKEQEQNLRLINLLHSTNQKSEQEALHSISEIPETECIQPQSSLEQLVSEKQELIAEQNRIRARLRTVNYLLSHRRTCSESGPWRNPRERCPQAIETARPSIVR